MFQLKTKTSDGLYRIIVEGVLSSDDVEELDHIINSLNYKDLNKIYFDGSNLQLITSVGVRSLVQLYTKSKENEVKLWFIGLTQQVKDVLEVVDLLPLFNTAEAESQVTD